VIAPFFADVDTRGELSGVVHLNQVVSNQTVVTWEHVGYFGAHDNLLNTFQLIVRGPNYAVTVCEGQIQCADRSRRGLRAPFFMTLRRVGLDE